MAINTGYKIHKQVKQHNEHTKHTHTYSWLCVSADCANFADLTWHKLANILRLTTA